MNILIVENDAITAKLLCDTLEKQGHNVTVTLNGQEAWRAYEAYSYSLLLVDGIMPGTNGVEFCRAIREQSRTHAPYILLQTAKSQREDQWLGVESGADDYVIKPCDPAELAVRIQIAERILQIQDKLHNTTVQLEQKQQELAAANQKLSEFATTDGLTGLKTYRYMREALDAAYSFAKRHALPFSLIMIDIDHFKRYNDARGFSAGDDALRKIAANLQKLLREHDVIGRYGSEEFLVLLPATDQTGCLHVAERIRAAVANDAWEAQPVTISLGTSTYQIGTPNALSLLEQADQALACSKRNGRNLVTCFLDRGFTLNR